MKKIYVSVLSCLLLFSVLGKADARVTRIEDSEALKMKREVNTWSCTDLGAGYHNSKPSGFTCTSFQTHGRTCYSNCSSNCNSSNYPYTSRSSCEADGGVVGSSCEYNGTTRYKCNCPSSYIECTSPKTGSGGHCTVNGQNKYAGCECPSEYQYDADNCNGTLSGQVCDGKYAQCTSSQPECTPYPYTLANCATPKVLGGNVCNDTYETCTCPSQYQYDATNCASPKVLSGGTCDNRRTSCTCPAEYQYDSTNCNGTLSGDTCDGKYANCVAACTVSAYPYTSQNCPSYIGTLAGNSCEDNGQTRYQTCTCRTDVNARTCPSGKIGVGVACNNKYIACAKQCQNGDKIYDDYHCYASANDMADFVSNPYYNMKNMYSSNWAPRPRGIVFDKDKRLAISSFTPDSHNSHNVGMYGYNYNFYDINQKDQLPAVSNYESLGIDAYTYCTNANSNSCTLTRNWLTTANNSFSSSVTTLSNNKGINETNAYLTISGWTSKGAAAYCRSYQTIDNALANPVPWISSDVEHFVPTMGDWFNFASKWVSNFDAYSGFCGGFYEENWHTKYCGDRFDYFTGTTINTTTNYKQYQVQFGYTKDTYDEITPVYMLQEGGGNTMQTNCFFRYPAGY